MFELAACRPGEAARLIACALLFLTTVGRGQESDSGFIDVHMHIDGVGAAKEGKPTGASEPPFGRMPPRQGPAMRRRSEMRRQLAGGAGGEPSAARLIAMMDENGVQRAIVMPPPQNPGQKGGYDYTALQDVVSRHSDRLILGGGGGTLNPLIQGTPADGVNDEVRQAFESQARKIIEAGARVFGEMTALHVCMNPKHHYVAAPPDHPLFLLLADIAARDDVAIDLHMEALSEEIKTPEKLLEACGKNPPALPATIPAFERLLEHNRKARVVWQHIGWDNTGGMSPGLMRRLLKNHANLFLAIKAVPERTRKNRLHDDDYQILPEWLALFKEFPDRVVVGADEFARAEGQQGGYKKPPFFEITWKMIAGLPRDLRKKIGRENAARIYGLL